MPSPSEYTVGTRVQGVVPAHYMRPVSISLTPTPAHYPYSGTSSKPTPGQYKDFMTSACQAWGIKEELQSKFAISFVDPSAEHKGERWLISSQREWELFWNFNSHLIGQQSTLKVFEIVVQPTLPSIFTEVTPAASSTTTTKPTATASTSPKHRKDATILPGFAYPSVIPESSTLGTDASAARARTVAADAIKKRASDDARAGISFRAGQHLYDVEKKMVKELEKANKNQEQQESSRPSSSTPAASRSAQPPPTSFTSSFPASSSAQRQLFPQFFSPFGPADGRFPGQHPSSAQAPFGGFRSSFPGPFRPPGPAAGASNNNDQQPLGQAYLDALNTIFPGATADGNGQSLLPVNGAEAAHRVLNALGKLTAKPTTGPSTTDAGQATQSGSSSASATKPTEATAASTQAPHEQQGKASSQTTQPQVRVLDQADLANLPTITQLDKQIEQLQQQATQAFQQAQQAQQHKPAQTDFERLMERSRAQGEALNAFFGNVTQRRAERLNGGAPAPAPAAASTAAASNAAVKADGNDSTDTPPSEPLREAESPSRNNDSAATATSPTTTTTTKPTIEAQNSYIEDLWQKRLRQMGHELPETHNYLSRFPQQSMQQQQQQQQQQQAPAPAPASAWTLPTSSDKSTTATTTRPVTVQDGNSSEPEEWEVLRQESATTTSASASTNGSNAADSPTTAAAAPHAESAATKEKGKARAVEINDGSNGSGSAPSNGAASAPAPAPVEGEASVEQNNQTLADAFEEMLARSRAQQ